MPNASSPAAANSTPPPAPLAADDLTLLRCFQRTRDEAAFAELLRRHWPMVLGVCRRHLSATPAALPGVSPAADAEDAAQTVFLLLARKAFWFRREVVLAGWLHHAALHTCRTLQRARLRQLHRDTEAARRATLEQPSAPPHLFSSSDSAALPPELARQLDDALATLPARLRDAVLLCHLQGRSRREAGVLLGCGENTVSKRLSRALPRLRSALQKRGVTLTAPALLAALGHTAAEADAATAPTALLLAAAKSQLGSLGAVAAGLAALSAWWPAPAALIVLAAATGWWGLRTQPEIASSINQTASAPAPLPAPAPPTKPMEAATLPVIPRAKEKSAADLIGEKLPGFTAETLVAFIQEQMLVRDPALVAAALRERLGLDLTPDETRALLASEKHILFGVFDLLARRAPHAMLAWAARLAPEQAADFGFVLEGILDREPDLTLARLDALLPAGPGREAVLNQLRLRLDPGLAATRSLADAPPAQRQTRLRQLAANWPAGREADALDWLATHARAHEVGDFLSDLVRGNITRDPDALLALVEGLRGSENLPRVLRDSLRQLVQQHRRVPEVLALLENVQGPSRAQVVAELADRWGRFAPDPLVEWLLSRPDHADLHAALPATLGVAPDDTRERLLAALLPTTDPATEAALIRAATPNLERAQLRSSALIERLQTRPGLAALSADSEANARLLWQATESVARNWTGRDGGDPRAAAAWVDRLRFANPADKAKIARLVYDQWRPSDAPAATAWARTVGVLPASP